MSYDVCLTTPDCSHCRRSGSQVFDQNMTSNVSGIWYRALMAAQGKTVPENWGSFGGAPNPLSTIIDPDGDQWSDDLGAFGPLANMTAGDAIPLLEKAADHIQANPSVYSKFEPNNGWGTASSAANFLKRLADAWKFNPEAVLRVSR